MNFKDIAAGDISAVFIDMDEFGELIFFNAVGFEPQQVSAVVDEDTLQGARNPNDGTFVSAVHLFVREEDLGYVPERDQLVYWGRSAGDVSPYIVKNVDLQMGVLVIRLEGNQA